MLYVVGSEDGEDGFKGRAYVFNGENYEYFWNFYSVDNIR